jgi:magnesium transporter
MPVTVLTYDPETGISSFDTIAEDLRIPERGAVWIDIYSSDGLELNQIAQRFGLHELTVEDCLTPDHFPKIEEFGSYLFILLRGLRTSLTGEATTFGDEPFTHKLAIYLSNRFIITYRRQEISWLDALARQVHQNPEKTLLLGPDALAHRVIDILFDRFERGLEQYERLIDGYEKRTAHSPEDFEMFEVLELKSKLVSLRQICRAQRSIILKLSGDQLNLIDPARLRYFKDIDDQAISLINTIDKQIDATQSLRDSYFALSNVRLGDTMRVLAVITTLLAPLNVIAGLYGMNFVHIPMLHSPNGFWIIVAVMGVSTALLLVLFKRKRWF